MKKINSLCVLITIILICLSSCSINEADFLSQSTKNESAKVTIKPNEVKNISQPMYKWMIDMMNNEKLYDELITKDYDENGIVYEYLNDIRSPAAGFQPDINDVNSKYPIECIRSIDDKYFYTIHKTKQGGLFYMFYEWADTKGLNSRNFYRHSIYSKKALKYSDFKDIKVGDFGNLIYKIDPVFQVCDQINIETTEAIQKKGDIQVQGNLNHWNYSCLLKDGIINFTFDRKNNNKIIDINYNKMFERETSFEIISYKIFEQDYIK